MGILATAADERVADVRFDDDRMFVDLMDGRSIAVPLAWYPARRTRARMEREPPR